MNSARKSPLHGLHPVQQSKQSPNRQLSKPNVAQRQTASPAASVKQPVAPPVYRPQPTPKVLQGKSTKSSQSPVAPSAHKPLAPPAYRPQPTPKVLQTKLAVRQVNQPGKTPVAPTASSPHPASKLLQMKDDGTKRVFPRQHKPNPAAQVSPGRKFSISTPSLPRRAMQRAPMSLASRAGAQAPRAIAVQRSLASIYKINSGLPDGRSGFGRNSGGALTYTHNGRTIQLKGNVIQGDFWDHVGYVYDFISASSIVATIVGAIASAASAGGLGWLAPFFIPVAGSAIQEFLKIEEEERGGEQLALHGRKQKYLELVSHMVNGVIGVVGILVGSGAVTAGAVTAGVVALIMIVLEGLRIHIIDRETVLGLVTRKVKECCRGGEREPILGN
jgi:hypothetical protein